MLSHAYKDTLNGKRKRCAWAHSLRYDWGQKYNGSFNTYFVPSSYATALYVGDPVESFRLERRLRHSRRQPCHCRRPILGVVIGIINGGDMGAINAVTRDLPVYHPASTAQYLAVCDDPNILYMNSRTTPRRRRPRPNLWAGKNANLVAGAGFDRDRLFELAAGGLHGCDHQHARSQDRASAATARQHHRHCCEHQHECQMAGQAQQLVVG
jgi:hypothetical protein